MPRLVILLVAAGLACATTPAPPREPAALATPALCDHAVPEVECVRHHPDLVPEFKARGDWCAEHEMPETQCLQCHPELKFVVLPKLPKDADLAFLSLMGEDVVALEPVPGKVTVFDFFAAWCGACRNVDAHVYGLLATRDDVAVRKLNVMSWDTPVAKRHLQKVSSLPYVLVYGRDGRLVREVNGLDLAALDAAIAEGAAR